MIGNVETGLPIEILLKRKKQARAMRNYPLNHHPWGFAPGVTFFEVP
jgi:hypothetical protein